MNPRSAITTITDWQTLSKKVKVDTNSSTSPNLFNVELGSVQGRIQGGGGRAYCPSSPPWRYGDKKSYGDKYWEKSDI